MTLDPRWRLALAVVASVLISQIHSVPWLAVSLSVALVLLGAVLWRDRALVLMASRRLLGVNTFVVLVWLVLPWSIQANALGLSEQGVALATQISLRINAIAMTCTALLIGLDAFAIARAAAGLGLPDRLARLLLLTVRYLGVLDDTRRRIDRAMRARGFQATASLRTLSVIAHQLALVLAHAIVRAERVDMALKARGWRMASASADDPSDQPGRPGRHA